ncbi:MAG: protein translocase subunit SecD [Alphaproteobacteria bacterium]|nr:protein translocase subunit SecD [Alphaproteobacteria bacterium]
MIQIPVWKRVLILVICIVSILLCLPNAFPKAEIEKLTWLYVRQVSLGLDLRGGSHLLLQVETQAVVKERIEGILDGLRTQLRREKIAYGDLQADPSGISFRPRDEAQRAKAQDIARSVARENSSSALALGFGETTTVTTSTTADGTIRIAIPDGLIREWRRSAVTQSIEIVRRRVDETGTKEPTIQRQGDDRIIVQLPGLDDPERMKRLLGKTAKLAFRFVEEGASPTGPLPAGVERLPTDEARSGGEQSLAINRRVIVSGDNLVDAQPSFRNGLPVVTFRFDAAGAKRFADASRDNVGRRFAIVLDNRVVSAPVIREAILGGSGEISGSFTVESAKDLALVLRAGALPAPLQVLEERSVGPGLGQDSIEAGKLASAIGFVAVILFMMIYYGLFGIFAAIALVINLALLIAGLSLLQATLTLPGIAGIVLTMGMAVDANVLIYERMREELKLGRSPTMAIDAGYERAFATIIDSNLTTLIAAVLLFFFGAGPIKGFAATLSIGIITSMFSAISVTRLMIVLWLRMRPRKTLPL